MLYFKMSYVKMPSASFIALELWHIPNSYYKFWHIPNSYYKSCNK